MQTKSLQPSMLDKLRAIEQSLESVKNAVEANSSYNEGRISREELVKAFRRKEIDDSRREVAMAREIVEEDIPGATSFSSDNVRKYISKNGDLIDRYGPMLRFDTQRVIGFDLAGKVEWPEKAQSGYFYGKHFHDSYFSKSGIVILRLGAMISAYRADGKKFVNECHTMEWKGNTITTTSGASITQVLRARELNGLTYIFAENGEEILIARSKVNEIIEGLESDLRK